MRYIKTMMLALAAICVSAPLAAQNVSRVHVSGVRISLQGGSTRTIVKQVPVYQVRRVVNPKGVWRRYNDNTPFDVTLMRITDVTAVGSEIISLRLHRMVPGRPINNNILGPLIAPDGAVDGGP